MTKYRHQIGRLIRRRRAISQTQLAMPGVQLNLKRVDYQLHPDPFFHIIVPSEKYDDIKKALRRRMIEVVKTHLPKSEDPASLLANLILEKLEAQVRYAQGGKQ